MKPVQVHVHVAVVQHMVPRRLQDPHLKKDVLDMDYTKVFVPRRRIMKKYIGLVFGVAALVGIYQSSVLQQDLQSFVSLQEIRKFAFAKNHKCGSSTIENIIFRFANKKQLNLVIPLKGAYLSRDEMSNHTFLEQVIKGVSYDIFSLHSRWNRKEVMTVLDEDVPAFTVIRNPVDAFLSLFYYFSPAFGQFFGAENIHDMVRITQIVPRRSILLERFLGFFGHNQMAWDLGLSPLIYENENAMKKEIKRLDREFDLVMISDRMDESLILLKELLQWPLENVVHLDLNRRKPEIAPTLSAEERKILSDWLSADVQIFEYFSRRLDERVSELNKKHASGLLSFFRPTFVKKETQLLNEANNHLYDHCVVSEVGNENLTGKFKETNDNTLGYLINENHEECALYAMSEPSYLEIFRNRLLEKSS